MTDRELLEAAARAAGLPFEWRPYPAVRVGSTWDEWNPLTDDGEALRLAVKLQLDIHIFGDRVFVNAPKPSGQYEISEKGDDMAAATRRAIVRAAAALGEQA